MTTTSVFTCPAGCDGSWPLESGFRAHLKARHRMDDEEIASAVAVGPTGTIRGDTDVDDEFTCDVCGKACPTARGLAVHKGQLHKTSTRGAAPKKAPAKKPAARPLGVSPVDVTLEHRWRAFCLLNDYDPAAELDRIRVEIIASDEDTASVDQLAAALAGREARAS